MSNLLINIRFLYWHFQWERGKYYPVVRLNKYYLENGMHGKWFAVYELFGWMPDWLE